MIEQGVFPTLSQSTNEQSTEDSKSDTLPEQDSTDTASVAFGLDEVISDVGAAQQVVRKSKKRRRKSSKTVSAKSERVAIFSTMQKLINNPLVRILVVGWMLFKVFFGA